MLLDRMVGRSLIVAVAAVLFLLLTVSAAAQEEQITFNVSQDADNDSISDNVDNCPEVFNPFQEDFDLICTPPPCLPCNPIFEPCEPCPEEPEVCVVFPDGIGDACDNCPDDVNLDQSDGDGDNAGDACDNCVSTPNPDQTNSDTDDFGDACDNCLLIDNDDQFDSDGDDFGNLCDNCPSNPNSNQSDTDGDFDGDICDNCRNVFNPGQGNLDEDRWGDACDNCPGAANNNQEDFNNDGEGDICDCNDNFRSDLEEGVDCGGSCFPDECPDCIPLRTTGNSSDKIDVVFVMDDDYDEDLDEFVEDAEDLIDRGYFGSVAFNESKCKFNFWYIKEPGNYSQVCAQFNVSKAAEFCPFRDSTAIVHKTGERDCASGGAFSTEPTSFDTVRHESGHSIISLKDEYCCDGGYGYRSCPNNFVSLENCTAYAAIAGIDDDKCFEFCPSIKCWPSNSGIANCTAAGNTQVTCNCTAFALNKSLDSTQCTAISSSDCPVFWQSYWGGKSVAPTSLTRQSPNWCNYRGQGYQACCGDDGWWKLDADSRNPANRGNCLMATGSDFNETDLICVERKFDSLPECPKRLFFKAFFDPRLAVVIHANLIRVNFTAYNFSKSMAIVLRGGAPNRFLDEGDFIINVSSAKKMVLEQFFIDDPRLFSLPEHVLDEENVGFEPGMLFFENVSFLITVGFNSNMNGITLVNASSGQIIGSIGIAQELLDFCNSNTNLPECLALDTDDDGVSDRKDFCLFTKIPEATVPSAALGTNRFALVNNDNVFDTVAPKGKGPQKSFTTNDTFGCSCEQILALTQDKELGHVKYGCSISLLSNFAQDVDNDNVPDSFDSSFWFP